MKVTHTYQRYIQESLFGLISSDHPKLTYIREPLTAVSRLALCGSAESVVVWNLRTSQKVNTLSRKSGQLPVTCVAVCLTDKFKPEIRIAAGFADGWVYVFNQLTGEIEVEFRAGKTKVSCMDFQNELLACASDSEINVFDIVSAVGTRLKGHRGLITQLKILTGRDVLISSAQDSFIKFWDLRTQHCFATLTGHPGCVWAFALARNDELLVSGTGDSHLRVWSLSHIERNEQSDVPMETAVDVPEDSKDFIVPLSQTQSLLSAEFLGSVQRSGTRRVHCLVFDPSSTYLFCQSFDRNIEVFRLLDTEEKVKRLRKKIKKKNAKGESTEDVRLDIADELRSVLLITLSAKPSSCDVLSLKTCSDVNSQKHVIRFICALKNNSVEEMEVALPVNLFKQQTLQPMFIQRKKCPNVTLVNRISSLGHRTIPIACSFTSDNIGIFTLSRSEAKLWSRRSTTCLVTLDWKSLSTNHTDLDNADAGNEVKPSKASSMVLAPGDRHAIIGFETGHILLFDLTSKAIMQSFQPHEGAVRGISMTGDKKGLVTGGSDKQVNFFNFDLKMQHDGVPGLCLSKSQPSQTVSDQITCLAVSPNNRLLVIAMMNFHVDVYFFDSFKRIHSLYGHAAPVTSLDISSDSRLVITGSGDKTVRLWELQFGNCQRRFTSHIEPVTCVRFIPHTSLAVSSDQAGLIKQWDVKKLREITTLKGHSGSVTCLATAITNTALLARKVKEEASKLSNIRGKSRKSRPVGDFDEEAEEDYDELLGGLIVSAGQDFSIRVWSEAEELLVLEEQEQVAREQAEEEEELVRSEAVIPGAMPNEASETGPLGRPTSITRDAADMLMEAIDIYEDQLTNMKTSKKPIPPHPLMIARGAESPERFLLKSLSLLRAPYSHLGGGGAGLEHALGFLTTDHTRRLLPRLAEWLSRGWEVELVGRAIRHLVILHFGLVTSSVELRDAIQQSCEARRQQLTRVKNLIGMNLAGLQYFSRKLEERENIILFNELITSRDKRIKKQKAKQARMALLLPG